MFPQEAEIITARRQRFLLSAALLTGLYILGAYRFDFSLSQLQYAGEDVRLMLSQLLRPRWDDLPLALALAIHSLQVAALGFFCGVTLTAPLPLLQTRLQRTPSWLRSGAAGVLSLLAGIPGLLLAALFIAATSHTTTAAVTAIAVGSFAAIARNIKRRRSILPDTFRYCLDTALILGLLGGGGVSSELSSALATADYRGVSAILLAIALMVAAGRTCAHFAGKLLARPSFPLGLTLFSGAIAAWSTQALWSELVGFGDISAVFTMLPPSMSAGSAVSPGLTSSVLMAIMGTVGATAIAVPLSLLVSRRTRPAKAPAMLVRMITYPWALLPELALAIILVRLLGAGAIAGIVALTLRSLGLLTGDNVSSLDEADPHPGQTAAASGVRGAVVVSQVILPQVRSQMLCNSLRNLRHNMRIATVLGLVGAGGIGHFLTPNLDFQIWPNLGMALIWIVIVIVATDYVTLWMEKRM